MLPWLASLALLGVVAFRDPEPPSPPCDNPSYLAMNPDYGTLWVFHVTIGDWTTVATFPSYARCAEARTTLLNVLAHTPTVVSVGVCHTP